MENVKEVVAGVFVGVLFLGLALAFAKASDPCHESNIQDDCASAQYRDVCVSTRRGVCE